MGIIIAKFRRKKSAEQMLEELDSEIKSIEEFGRTTEQTHKKLAARFILVSVLIYVVSLFMCYFYFLPVSLYERLFYLIPLGLAPIIILYIKKILTWYYNRKLNKNKKKIGYLRDEKKKILDKVMETETYKVAKIILDKYAPETVKKPIEFTPSQQITPIKTKLSSTTVTGIRYRGTTNTTTDNRVALLRNQSVMTPYGKTPSTPLTSRKPIDTSNLQIVRSTPMQLPRDRTVIDKMVDYLVGDGPSNKYALICKQCSGHNGLAFKEEFEYYSFRCCYCQTFNPARKQRPIPPTIHLDSTFLTPRHDSDSSEDDEKKSSSDSDSETRTDVVETTNVQTLSNNEPMDVVTSSSVINNENDVICTNPFEENCEMEIDSGVEKDNDNIKSDEND